mmetsp:Transcript_1027/g.1918  ORF Transcript_1027/g.1918 Transcript_1027/m.1918 type:complete len:147 (+) Transcript_1027:636-1076(+)
MRSAGDRHPRAGQCEGIKKRAPRFSTYPRPRRPEPSGGDQLKPISRLLHLVVTTARMTMTATSPEMYPVIPRAQIPFWQQVVPPTIMQHQQRTHDAGGRNVELGSSKETSATPISAAEANKHLMIAQKVGEDFDCMQGGVAHYIRM